MLPVKLLRNVIVFAALVSFVLGIVLLIWPFNDVFQGVADRSAAVTSALALIVATIGLVLALHMQSAEYRRETEVIDGLQELRVLLEIMTARCALDRMFANSETDDSAIERSGFLEEKQVLLELLHQMPGRFLVYFSAVKHMRAKGSKAGEDWRLLHLHIASIRRAARSTECVSDIVKLLKLVRQIKSSDISQHAKGFISASSIDELNKQEGNLVVDSMIRLDDAGDVGGNMAVAKKDPFQSDTQLESAISEIQQILAGKADSAAALAECADYFVKARAGDVESRVFIADFRNFLVRRNREAMESPSSND